MALVLIPVILNWLPISISAVAGVSLMILTGCLQMDEAYRLIDWRAVFLIAGMLPLGIALDHSGAAQLIGDGMISIIGSAGPLAVAAGLFLLASRFYRVNSFTRFPIHFMRWELLCLS